MAGTREKMDLPDLRRARNVNVTDERSRRDQA